MGRRKQKFYKHGTNPSVKNLLNANFSQMSPQEVEAHLMFSFRSKASNTTRAKVVKACHQSFMRGLNKMETAGADFSIVERVAKSYLNTLQEISRGEPSAVRHQIEFSSASILKFIEHMRAKTFRNLPGSERAKLELYLLTASRAGGTQLQEEISRRIRIVAGAAVQEASMIFLDGQPTGDFTKPLKGARRFLMGLQERPAVSEKNRELIHKIGGFLASMCDPAKLRERIETVNVRKTELVSAADRAKNIRSLAEVDTRRAALHLSHEIDGPTSSGVSQITRGKRKEISTKILSRMPAPKQAKFERYEGHVWLGRWVPLYKLKRYLSGMPQKKAYLALADFKPLPTLRKSKPLGFEALKLIREAEIMFNAEKPVAKPTIIELLEFMERKGRKIK
ncbi:MAG: hypothetical protein N3F05_01145 [Candidatus Diapherotrites archaeon]|nr:hypothetical protein [Candidatus Diapherotrites archaeon]